MPLDPHAQTLLEQAARSGAPAFDTMSVAEARAAGLLLATLQGDAPAVARIEERLIPGPAGEIPIRIYKGDAPGPRPVVVYFHGGGWVIGSLETHDVACRRLANAIPAVVVSVDYRLAPEHKFPAPVEDAYAATRWVAEHAALLDGNPRCVAVAGDSAGGNLAAAVSLMARDRHGPRLRYQLLVYPVIDGECGTPSYTENAEGYLLTRASMLWFWNHYLRTEADRAHPYASPAMAADLRGLPPATIITAEFDPLRDEGEAYATRLRAAGVQATLRRYAGLIHGFFTMSGVFPQAREAIEASARDVAAALGSGRD